MTLKLIGSGEIVEQVFWLDTRSRTCGVKLRNPVTSGERCCESLLANFELQHADGRTTRASVENAMGTRAQVILLDEL